MRILVDTSAWSLALRRDSENANKATRELLAELINDALVEIIGPIRQEILTGIKSQKKFDELKRILSAFTDIELKTPDFELAAQYANVCRSKGIQGSHTDFLICSVATNNNLAILTYDKDFVLFSKHLPIKLYGNRIEA